MYGQRLPLLPAQLYDFNYIEIYVSFLKSNNNYFGYCCNSYIYFIKIKW